MAITRYPPGMCAALSKMQRPNGTNAAVGHLWATGDVDAAEIGTALTVETNLRSMAATVVEKPFYDPKKSLASG